ncbi:MAG: ATP-binding cassette domain-containing protein [Holosporaceae bacterium]|jgi:D-methionine transport system ATP-binding protein|nr:ATP-binding cassette domain-containing protein [Holosporaceae bacterium]
MIALKNVSKNYDGFQALDSVSLEIPPNVVYGIIGKSGAGKSTLVRLTSLLEKPDEGEIYFDDRRVDNLKGDDLLKCRRQFGMIFQHFNLFSSRDVFGNVAYPLEIAGESKETIKDRVFELLELVGLADKATRPISKLSGGQKQRAAIARALANRPKFLFCDEATSALDPQTTASILKLITDIRDKAGLTVVMITHQMNVVRDACDYVSVIDGGKVIESGTVKDLIGFPKTQIARDFVSTLGSSEEKALKTAPSNSIVCRLHFGNDAAAKPVISQLIRDYRLDANILSGAIRLVGEQSLGELTLELIGSADDLAAAVRKLRSQGIAVEELPRD